MFGQVWEYIADLETAQRNLKIQNAELLKTVTNFQDVLEFYNHSLLGHFILDRKAQIISSNFRGANMLGLNIQSIINTAFYNYIPTESRIIFLNFIEGIFRGSQNAFLEISFSLSNIKRLIIKINGYASKNEGLCQITLCDITEQKLADEENIKTRKHYMAIIENAPDGIALLKVINDQFSFTYISPAGYKMFGFDSQYIPNIPILVVHPDDREYVQQNIRKVLSDKTYNPILEYRNNTVTGEYKWIKSKITNLLDDPNVNAIVINFHDITERKLTSLALIESEKLYRNLVETAGEGIVVQKEGRFIFVNPKMIVLTGFEKEELMSKPFSEFIHPEDRDLVLRNYIKHFSNENTDFQCQFRFYRKNFSIAWFEMSGVVIDWMGEKALLNFISDITDRKIIEIDRDQHLLAATAKNRISETIMTTDDPIEILESSNRIIYEKFKLDMSTVFYISFTDKRIEQISSWPIQEIQEISGYFDKATSFDDFSVPLTYLMRSLHHIESHSGYLSPDFNFDDNLREILHGQYGIRSLLWYPLFIDKDGYYLFNLNHFDGHRTWSEFDLELLESLVRELGLALIKIRFHEERKKATLALTQSEQKYRTIFENVQDVFFTINTEGLIIDISPSIKYFTEFDRNELVGSHVQDVYVNLEDRPIFWNVMMEKKEIQDYELSIKSKSNIVKHVSVNARLVYDNTGKATHVAGALRDITRRKIAEDILKSSLEQLQNLTQHIQKVREEERLSISRELHDDIGQLLTAIRMDLSNLKSKVAEKALVSQIEKLMRLVSDTIKSVQNITSHLRPSIIDLGIEDAIEWYTNEFAERNGIDVIRSIGLGLKINSDTSLQIFRIMQESFTNIARHSKATQVTLSLSQKSDHIILKITDNGIGIKDKEISAKNSFGILSMKERASSMGGKYEIGKMENGGTFINLTIPYPND